jgi:hypothetical protein
MPQLDLGKVVGDTGPQGPKGDQGIQGPAGQAGPGVAVGGSANQVLVKHSGTNYDTQWVDAGNLPSIAGVQDAVAIVANGDTHPAIADGQFVYVRNHSTLAEGLYKATAAIGTDVALTTSNLTADGSGGLNDLKGQIDSLNSKLSMRSSSLQDAPIAPTVNAIYYNDYFAFITYTSGSQVWSEGDSFGTIPSGMCPASNLRATGNTYATNVGVQIRIATDGSVKFDSKTSVDGRISFTVMYVLS